MEKMLNVEIAANKGKRGAAMKAKEAGIDEAFNVFDEISKDEARHALMQEGLKKIYFGK